MGKTVFHRALGVSPYQRHALRAKMILAKRTCGRKAPVRLPKHALVAERSAASPFRTQRSGSEWRTETLYMTYPSKEPDTTLYCGVNSIICYYIQRFANLLTGKSYMIYPSIECLSANYTKHDPFITIIGLCKAQMSILRS